MKIAFMFPGQGAQVTGMGKDIYDKYEEARKVYDRASEILKMDVGKLCFWGEQEELNKTANAQIAILVTSLAILEVLKKYNIKADVCTGLSLGEYTALIHSGYLSFEDGLKLIEKRGYYMQNFIPDEEFKMEAVIGLEAKVIEEVCSKFNEAGEFVVPANYNYSMQTVISGNSEAVDKLAEILKEKGAKRIIELKTSGPFHTNKLSKAKEKFEKELLKVNFGVGKIPVIKNIDGTVYSKEDNLKQILANHIISPVRFDKTIEKMKDLGIDTYIEIGPGKALSGFVKKDNKEATILNVSNLETLEVIGGNNE